MTEKPSAPPPPPSSGWDDLDAIVYRFECAWESGTPPSIDAYLSEAAVDPGVLKTELAIIDLECRLKAGEAVRAEGYFARYPELAADRERALNLITTEYAVRRRWEPGLAPDEFLRRFPQYREDLATQLAGPHRSVRGRLVTQLPCPHCRQLVTLEGDAQEREISCSACGHSFRVDDTPPVEEVPVERTRLNQFQLLEVVGQGGFGTVYRARDTQLDRVVAVKVPRGLRGGSWESERFLREARNAAQLTHPGIVPLYEVGHAGTLPYIVSAFIRGRTLAEEISGRRLGFREAAGLVAQVAGALAYAHGRGVVHRDLKPSNIMVGRVEEFTRAGGEGTPGEIRAFVTDFGLARRDQGEARVTLDGQILGTPLYMSPEQARGEGHAADARSDTYSLGVILYELLTGEAPFRGAASMIFKQILEDEPRPPRRLNDKIPRDLETVTLKCLAKEPGRRYQTADDLAADLGRFLADRPVLARPAGRVERTWRWARRNPRVAALGGLVAVLLLSWAVGGPVALLYIDQQRRVAVQATAEATTAKLRAEQERDRAETQVNLSLKILYQVVQQFQEGIKNYPALNQWKQRLLKVGLDGLEEVARTAHTSRGERGQVSAHSRLGDIYLVLGKTAEARKEYEQAFDLARALVRADPEDGPARGHLYVTYGKLGDISYRVGEIQKAEEFYRQAVETARTRANAQTDAGPEQDEARNDLILSLNKLGQITGRRGRPDEARQYFAEALRVGEALQAAHPDDPRTRESLGQTFTYRGQLELVNRHPAEALTYFQRGLSLYEVVTAVEPDNSTARLHLARSYLDTGDASLDQGRHQEALARFHKALAQHQALAKEDPSNREIQGALALDYERLHRVFALLNDLPAALDWARKIQETRAALGAGNPEDTQRQYEWAVACYQVGQVHLLLLQFHRAAESFQQGWEVFHGRGDGGKLAHMPEAQSLLKGLEQGRAVAKMAPHMVDNLALALWGSEEGLPAVAAGTVGLLGAPQGHGHWLALANLFPGRAGPVRQAGALLKFRAAVLARRGQFAEADATVERLRDLTSPRWINALNVAHAYAACVGAIVRGKTSGELAPHDTARKERYAGLAVAALNEAVRLGHDDPEQMLRDRALAPIFQDKGFRKTIANLQERNNQVGRK